MKAAGRAWERPSASCIVVRCDHPGSPLSLHLSVSEPDIEGDIELVIDEDEGLQQINGPLEFVQRC